MYEVAIVSPGQFLAVIADPVLHEGSKLAAEELDALGWDEQFDVGKDDEIVCSGVAVLLEALLEGLPHALLEQPAQESPGYADELFMGVVVRALV